MSGMYKSVCIVAIAAAACLSACSKPPVPAVAVVKPDMSSALANIRAAGNKFDSSVEVHPLRDPAVDGLVEQARQLEARQQPAQAIETLSRALKIAPNSPDLLQFQAELFVETNDWRQAQVFAEKSYDLGPKVGALCARNVQTMIEIGKALSDPNAAALAKQKMTGCSVPAPNRF